MLVPILLLGSSLTLINGQEPPWIRNIIGSTVTGEAIVGGVGPFPRHGGAGAGEMFRDGTRNGFGGSPVGMGAISPFGQMSPMDHSMFGQMGQHGPMDHGAHPMDLPRMPGQHQLMHGATGLPVQGGNLLNSLAFEPAPLVHSGPFDMHGHIDAHGKGGQVGVGPTKMAAKPIGLFPKKGVIDPKGVKTIHHKTHVVETKLPYKGISPFNSVKPGMPRKSSVVKKTTITMRKKFQKPKFGRENGMGLKKGHFEQNIKPFLPGRGIKNGVYKKVY